MSRGNMPDDDECTLCLHDVFIWPALSADASGVASLFDRSVLACASDCVGVTELELKDTRLSFIPG